MGAERGRSAWLAQFRAEAVYGMSFKVPSSSNATTLASMMCGESWTPRGAQPDSFQAGDLWIYCFDRLADVGTCEWVYFHVIFNSSSAHKLSKQEEALCIRNVCDIRQRWAAFNLYICSDCRTFMVVGRQSCH